MLIIILNRKTASLLSNRDLQGLREETGCLLDVEVDLLTMHLDLLASREGFERGNRKFAVCSA